MATNTQDVRDKQVILAGHDVPEVVRLLKEFQAHFTRSKDPLNPKPAEGQAIGPPKIVVTGSVVGGPVTLSGK